MCEKDLNELFDGVEIIPCQEAKQQAKARMLEAAEQMSDHKPNIFRRYIMELNQTARKAKFRLTRHHMQGAVAMLLAGIIVVSTMVFTPGINLLGTIFRGFEDAEEITLMASPSSIDARADFETGIFTLSGLPAGETGNITEDHIALGGYLDTMAVESITAGDESITITLVQGEFGFFDSDPMVDWQGISSDALIAISPEAFRNKNFFYQAVIEVVYPEMLIDVEFIDFNPDQAVNQVVNLTLINDSFIRAIEASDIAITGGIDDGTVSNLSQNGNGFSFNLSGVLDGSIDSIAVVVTGDALEKGYDLTAVIQKGRVPSVEQASPLYATTQERQELEVYVENDTFAQNLTLSMLTFEGSVGQAAVAEYERVDDNHLKLIIEGRLESGEGGITFSSAAFESGRARLTAYIHVAQPELYFYDDQVMMNTNNPSFRIMTNYYSDEVPELELTVGGALSGTTVANWEWDDSVITLELAGTAVSGGAFIETKGMFETRVDFTVNAINLDIAPEEPTQTPVIRFHEPYSQYVPQYSNLMPSNEPFTFIPTVDPADRFFYGVNVTKMALHVKVTAVTQTISSVAMSVTAAISLFQMFDSIFGWGIFGPSDHSIVMERLDEIERKIEEVNDEVKKTQDMIIRGFTENKYDVNGMFNQANLDYLSQFIRTYRNMINTLEDNPDELERQLKTHLTYGNSYGSETKAYNAVGAMYSMLNKLDPYTTNARGEVTGVNTNSLTYDYAKLAKIDTPFYHNTADMLHEYMVGWETTLCGYIAIISTIFDTNTAFNPASANFYAKERDDLLDRIIQVNENMTKYLVEDHLIYFEAREEFYEGLDKPYVQDGAAVKNITYGQRSYNYDAEQAIVVYLNKTGAKYGFFNTGDRGVGSAYSVPYGSYNATSSNDTTQIGTDFNNIALGAGSVFGSFSNINNRGLTFNQFMTLFTNGAWWNPDFTWSQYSFDRKSSHTHHNVVPGTATASSISSKLPQINATDMWKARIGADGAKVTSSGYTLTNKTTYANMQELKSFNPVSPIREQRPLNDRKVDKPISGNDYYIANYVSMNFLTPHNRSVANGARLSSFKPDNNPLQAIKFTQLANNEWRLTVAVSEKSLYTSGANVYQGVYKDSKEFKWRLIDLGDGVYNIQNVGTGNVLTLDAIETFGFDGTYFNNTKANGTVRQKFVLFDAPVLASRPVNGGRYYIANAAYGFRLTTRNASFVTGLVTFMEVMRNSVYGSEYNLDLWDTRFQVEFIDIGGGKWVLKYVNSGYLLGAHPRDSSSAYLRTSRQMYNETGLGVDSEQLRKNTNYQWQITVSADSKVTFTNVGTKLVMGYRGLKNVDALQDYYMSLNLHPARNSDEMKFYLYEANNTASGCRHTYDSSGYCTKCREDFPIMIASMSNTTMQAAKSNIPVRLRPYAPDEILLRLSVGTPVTITGRGTNSVGNLWYRVSIDDKEYWIFSDNLK
ncbi:MAG: RICIN domain-containing protein [Oscillospiraceae bacterium]|nr:RICIN domain-containing protein [Oscillospiraceae bacterium]